VRYSTASTSSGISARRRIGSVDLQLVYILRGHIQFTAAGGTLDACTGDSFVVPGGVEHQARALEESEVLDVFTPFRDDYGGK
jgi:quercetin dioxygenase-like cupin family protein